MEEEEEEEEEEEDEEEDHVHDPLPDSAITTITHQKDHQELLPLVHEKKAAVQSEIHRFHSVESEVRRWRQRLAKLKLELPAAEVSEDTPLQQQLRQVRQQHRLARQEVLETKQSDGMGEGPSQDQLAYWTWQCQTFKDTRERV